MNAIQKPFEHAFASAFASEDFQRLPLNSAGFKPKQRCIPQLGGEFRALRLVLVYFHVPRLRLVDELGASVPFVRNHALQVARVPCVHLLET